MPVTGTTAGNPGGCTDSPSLPGAKNPTAPPVTCVNQHVIVPRVPTEPSTGVPVLSRTHAYEIRGEQKATIRHTMRDVNGNAVDLSNCLCDDDGGSLSATSSLSAGDCTCPYDIVFRLSEYLSGGGKQYTAEITDAANGVVEVTLLPEDTCRPGIYFGEFALVECDEDLSDNPTGDTTVLFSNQMYVHIGRNLWNNGLNYTGPNGPPSIAEIRLHLRDSDPAESFLLDNLAFSDEEIIAATHLPVQYWNEIPPPVGVYNTATFPFRYHWLMAIAGYLFLTAAEQMRRNNLRYSASGVNIDDQDKEPNYEAAAQRRIMEFKDFVRRKKVEINVSNAYRGVSSPYGW